MLTTILELLGFSLLIVGASLFVGHWSVPGGFATAGVLVIVVSLIIERPWRKRQ